MVVFRRLRKKTLPEKISVFVRRSTSLSLVVDEDEERVIEAATAATTEELSPWSHVEPVHVDDGPTLDAEFPLDDAFWIFDDEERRRRRISDDETDRRRKRRRTKLYASSNGKSRRRKISA